MATSLAPLQWKPYQAGGAGSLIFQVTLDSATDTDFHIPINAFYSNHSLAADGVIANNTANNGDVFLTIGPLLTDIPPFSRDYLSLDQAVGLNLGVMFTVGKVTLTFYIGTPPFAVSLTNYYGAAAAVVPNLQPITNSLVAPVVVNGPNVLTTGPIVNQGSIGKWYASGTLTLQLLMGANSNVIVMLWDGVTEIASTELVMGVSIVTVALSGFILSPVSGIRLSAAIGGADQMQMLAATALSTKTSTVSAFRVA